MSQVILLAENVPLDLTEFFEPVDTENRQDVFRIASAGHPGAHFAVFPPKLIEPMILAGTSAKGACAKCGAPWRRALATSGGSRADPESRGTRDRSIPSNRNGITGSLDGEFRKVDTVGWEPGCACRASGAAALAPDGLEVVSSPTGSGGQRDDCLITGRAGHNRERGADDGIRPITRWEQRAYAAQLRASPHRAEMAAEAGAVAFSHYLRTDKSGARPPSPGLLETWIACGWLDRAAVPDNFTRSGVVPCVILDPFIGSGTTAAVAVGLGRRCWGIDLSEAYLRDHAVKRVNDALRGRPSTAELAGEGGGLEVPAAARKVQF